MTNQAIILLIIAVAAIAAVGWSYYQLRKTRRLKSKFGPEYERTVHELGGNRRAEAALEAREKRVATYHIRPLTREESARFAAEWRTVQEHFVDNPAKAVTEADQLINQALQAGGCGMGEFGGGGADLSVEHA